MKRTYDKERDILTIELFPGAKKQTAYTTIINCGLPEPWHRVDTQVAMRGYWDEDGKCLAMEFEPASALVAADGLKTEKPVETKG